MITVTFRRWVLSEGFRHRCLVSGDARPLPRPHGVVVINSPVDGLVFSRHRVLVEHGDLVVLLALLAGRAPGVHFLILLVDGLELMFRSDTARSTSFTSSRHRGHKLVQHGLELFLGDLVVVNVLGLGLRRGLDIGLFLLIRALVD